MDAIEKAVDWAVEYGDVLSVSADTRFPNLVVKGAVGGLEHVISVDNGASYMEMWRDGSGSYYVTTGAKTVPFPGLAKGARLDEALDRFFRLMARKARTRRRPAYRRQVGRRRITPYTRKAAPGIGPSRSVGHLRPSGVTPESPAKRLAKRLLAEVRKNIIGLSTPRRRRVRKGCPCADVAKDEGGWSGRPRGWTDESVRSFWRTLTREDKELGKALVRKWGFTECVERIRGHVDDPEAFCAASHKEALGRWPAEDPD